MRRVERGSGDPGGTRGRILDNHASRDDHQETLAWLDSSVEWARAKDQTGLVELLILVRTEVLFDMDLSGSPPSARDRANVGGPALGVNRSV